MILRNPHPERLVGRMSIADCIETKVQGRVYGAHFSGHHLWWLIAYPLAGWHRQSFMYGGLIALFLLVVLQLLLFPNQVKRESVEEAVDS
ncbi:MAG: hypothetical protein VKL59_20445 [Nostocaceae cyanobacterium]|nr:hypothetical protein [Nostocaceae cyanobacterium]